MQLYFLFTFFLHLKFANPPVWGSIRSCCYWKHSQTDQSYFLITSRVDCVSGQLILNGQSLYTFHASNCAAIKTILNDSKKLKTKQNSMFMIWIQLFLSVFTKMSKAMAALPLIFTCVIWVCVGGGGGAPFDFELFLSKKNTTQSNINSHSLIHPTLSAEVIMRAPTVTLTGEVCAWWWWLLSSPH